MNICLIEFIMCMIIDSYDSNKYNKNKNITIDKYSNKSIICKLKEAVDVLCMSGPPSIIK